jgi:hypothetical protein
VRFLTPEVDRVLALFRHCYTRRYVSMQPPTWERTAWPRGTALEHQDARDLSALEWVRDVMNRIEVDDWKRAMDLAARPRPPRQQDQEAAPAGA